MTHIHIELDHELHKNAKVEALLNNIPLKEYIIKAIKEKINNEKSMLK